jgi:tRNA threonylcarbamoyl adenosine modification protein (Sua5/YciO/YrdC/YwlC family)
VNTRLVQPDAPADDVVAEACAVLVAGGLLIYPTDTLYALGCAAYNAPATRRIREAKGRDDGKPLPLIAADLAQVRKLAPELPPAALALAASLWPGRLTLVLPASPSLPNEITSGGSSVAVRVPDLALARSLCAVVGPLVSTSANRSGHPAPATCAAARAEVGTAAALALDGGPGTGVASTVVDLTGNEPRLLRVGAVPWSEVTAALRRAPA